MMSTKAMVAGFLLLLCLPMLCVAAEVVTGRSGPDDGTSDDERSLDDYIDRDELGLPGGPDPANNWSDLRDYVQYAVNDTQLAGAGDWSITYNACLAYWGDASMFDMPVKDGSGYRKRMDEEFAKKCLAYALVCWQAPEWGGGQAQIDIIGPNGIEPWPFYHAETPTFVYRMQEALSDILSLPVDRPKGN